MKAIYLTGFMGSGKTTVGKELSERIGVPVVDTDEFIVKEEQRSITEIFETDGEKYFREAETKALRSLPTEDVIVTTGGGIILKKENRDYMKINGIVLFLYCTPEVVYERLKNDTSRPLLSGDKMKEIKLRFAERLPLYNEADYTIDTSTLTITDTVETIIVFLTKTKQI